VTIDPSVTPPVYNYEPVEVNESTEVGGHSCFLMDGDKIFHTYSTYARGSEPTIGAYALLDLAAGWLFPPGSFGDEPVTLDGVPVLAMSVSGMLAMKEQFPHLRNGGIWRQKDIDDIKMPRRLAAEADAYP
jgi:Bacterial protein of unknown function (DUF899)